MTEAALFFDVSRQTVASWIAGRAPVPPAAWTRLSQLYRDMRTAANMAVAVRDPEADPVMAGGGVRSDSFDPMPVEATEGARAMAILMAIDQRSQEARSAVSLG